MNKKKGADRHGRFTRGSCCSCPEACIQIQEVQWGSVRFTSFLFGLVNLAAKKLGFSGMTHHFLAFWFACGRCRARGCLTVDYNNAGISARFGRYKLLSKDFRRKKRSLAGFSLPRLRSALAVLKADFSVPKYRLFKNNCQHFAKALWRHLL